MAPRPFSATHRSRETSRTIRDGSKAIFGKRVGHETSSWDMACQQKVVRRVYHGTGHGLLEGRCESIKEHSTWLVGRLVGRSNHGNHGTKSILGNGRSCRHRGPPVVILGKTSETMVIMGNRVGTTVTMGKKGRLYVQSMARGPIWA
jgi:hypothetical protein